MLRNCEIMGPIFTFLYLTSGVYGVRNISKYCRKSMKHCDNNHVNAHY